MTSREPAKRAGNVDGTNGDTPAVGLSVTELRQTLQATARQDGVDHEKMQQMEAYMRNQFRFLGLTTPVLRRAIKPFVAAGADADGTKLLATAWECWQQDEREFQHAGLILLRKWAKKLQPAQLEASRSGRGKPSVEALIIDKSWWDTIDSLAPWTVGTMVTSHPELVTVMDRWITDDNIWLARTAILHQLSYKEQTDADRLFHYSSLRAEDSEFFIRKAIGWALRQYARQDSEAVKRFVAENEDRLSGLSKREALKHLR